MNIAKPFAPGKVYFVGAGPGAPDLITLRGLRLLEAAGCIVYAGSLVNPELLAAAPPGCRICDSAALTLEQVVDILADAVSKNQLAVRLHTGDPSIYGAIREQLDALAARAIPCEVVPGVSSFCAAAAALPAEYTLPGVSQTVILTRMEGRTPVPPKEDITLLAAHRASMAVFLSAAMLDELSARLVAGGYDKDTPAAIVVKASWPDEKVITTTVAGLPDAGKANGVSKTALVLVGDFLGSGYDRSLLYHPDFTHGYRQGTPPKDESKRGPLCE